MTGRAFRLLGTMLMSGVPLVEGIRLCQHAVKNRLFRDLFVEVERDVLQGAGLARPLLAARFLPPAPPRWWSPRNAAGEWEKC